jgi:predicted transposase YbfD/YdcC
MIYRHENLESLASYFAAIEEPRDNRGKRHRLIDLLIMTIYGCLWGHTDFTNMAAELKMHEAYFTKLLDLENGVPSHDTFSAVFSLIDPNVFLECFLNWLSSVVNPRRQQVAIDGKAVRAACDKVHRGKMPYLVNAYMVEAGLCIGQIRIDEKTNEIKGIPEMLEWLDLEGSVVTMDAIGCQKDITKQLAAKHADFVLPVKDNQANLHHDIESEMDFRIYEKAKEDVRAEMYARKRISMDRPAAAAISTFVQHDQGHARIERRTYYVCQNPESIDAKQWPNVVSAGMVIRERTVIHKDEDGNVLTETPTVERETYILSRVMDAEEFACYARGHWGIENSLHWVLDDYFREDRCTARIGHATENLALMRKIVYNLMKLDQAVEKKSMKAKQVYYRNKPQAVEHLLFGVIPHRYESSSL